MPETSIYSRIGLATGPLRQLGVFPEARGSADIHSIVVDEFLRKIVHNAFDATAKTFRAICLAGSEFAANLMAFALGACLGSVNAAMWGRRLDSHARALEILGACLASAERSLGESKPASVEERLSGVEASIERGIR
jgi:hypothetical protein